MTRPITNRCPTSFRRGRSVRRRGQILVIALLAIVVLVSLVVYVYNVGGLVNRRLEVQNAADSAAISGSTWMARSMNVVAMNNCATSRMLALVPVMDALPLATEMSGEEVTAWEQCLADQLRRPIPNQYGEADLLRTGMETLRARMAHQRDILYAAHLRLDPDENGGAFDMREMTHWSVRGYGGAEPHGQFWRAAAALQNFSAATVESAGLLAQADAVEYGRAAGAQTAFVIPVAPELPARWGEFEDFQPVLEGRLSVQNATAGFSDTDGAGGAIPDREYPHRLGPWARLFPERDEPHDFWDRGWRHPIREATAWEYIPATPGAGQTRGGGGVGVGGRRVGGSARTPGSGHGGYRRATDWRVLGYTTYGPYHWAMRHINWWANDHEWLTPEGRQFHAGELPDTFFYRYLRNIADIKLGHMFGPDEVQLTHFPQWVTPYPDAVRLGNDENIRVTQTMFYLVEIASSVPATSPNWLSPGTFRTNGDYPIAIWANGWVDPMRWGVPKVADYIWRDEYTYEATQDTEIGIRLQIGADGEPVWQPVYMYAWYIFGGVDVGGEIEVRNPCNWDAEASLPRPVLLDTSGGDYAPDPDSPARRESFTFLGIARRGAGAPVWAERFASGNPDHSVVAVAQAKLFNHSSWDLWTQDWQAQLAPVSQWGDWVQRAGDDVGRAEAAGGLVGDETLADIAEYLSALSEPLAERYMDH